MPFRDGSGRSATNSPGSDAVDATSIVLDAIRLGAARSRSEVMERTGLGRAVVAQRIAELKRHGLIVTSGTRRSTGGRPPGRLAFGRDAGYVLSADLGATSIDVAIADLSGTILQHRTEAADVAAGPVVVLARIEELFRELVQDRADGPGPLYGIGLGVPGPVEFDSGRPVAPPIMPGWDGYPVREQLESAFDAPVWVDNDVNVMVMGEWRVGVARGHRNVVFVKIGTGIGAGLISDGQLHRGSTGSAGDMGHAQVVEDGVVCRCGNVGCLEALAGGHALARDAETVARTGRSQILGALLEAGEPPTARHVADAASRGDAASVELLQRSASHVGGMLATVVNLFNPSLIVVGGGVASAGDLYLATIRQAVYRRSLPLATRSLQIVPTGLGSMAGVVGAAVMVADEIFSADRLASTLGRFASPQPVLEEVS
ncbi:MAG TPA: ROK family protein [Vitreimonas sp.]|nr:ROK family protein [Vitreimonas sp.]